MESPGTLPSRGRYLRETKLLSPLDGGFSLPVSFPSLSSRPIRSGFEIFWDRRMCIEDTHGSSLRYVVFFGAPHSLQKFSTFRVGRERRSSPSFSFLFLVYERITVPLPCSLLEEERDSDYL